MKRTHPIEKRGCFTALFFALLLLCALCLSGCPEKDAGFVPFTGCTHAYSAVCDGVCDLCKEARTTDAPHTYSAACDGVCDLCKEARTTDAPHTYATESLCEDKTCTACGFLLPGAHDYAVTGGKEPTLLAGGDREETCSKCGNTRSSTLPALTAKDLGMSAVYITERADVSIPLVSLTKADGEIPVDYTFVGGSDDYGDFSCVATMKVQGATSAEYPKKNYTVKLYKDGTLTAREKVDFGWGRESKYCMKANYVDSSHARNIVGARLAAEVMRFRPDFPDTLASAPNGGLIDGFPILVYINGSFHGLYTMNIPKDNWQFGMEKEAEEKQALLMGAAWRSSVRLEKRIGQEGPAHYGWEVEHCSSADESWIPASFNRIIETLLTHDRAYIRAQLPKYVDIDAAIDNFILTYAMCAADNMSKNVLWATYDGVQWIPMMYDMDGTFGIRWHGAPTDPQTNTTCVPTGTVQSGVSLQDGASQLQYALVRYFPEELQARYFELRESILTVENVDYLFWEFQAGIAPEAYAADSEIWPTLPYAEENRGNMIVAFEAHLAKLDNFFFRFY